MLNGLFKWRLSPAMTLLALVVMVMMIGLGFWQLDRAGEKEALFERFEQALTVQPELLRSGRELSRLAEGAEGPVYEPARLRGQYDSRRQFVMENRPRDGQDGYEILTPLRLTDGTIVIVNRGWVPRGRTRDRLPDIDLDGGRVDVSGLLRRYPRPGLRLGESVPAQQGWPRRVNYPRPEDLAAVLDEPVAQLMLLLGPEEPQGYRRDWRPAVSGPVRHYGYAVQWFGMALALLVICLVINMRRGRESGDNG